MKTIILTVALALAATLPAVSAEDADSAFDRITAHYEKIRIALVGDSVDGVATEAAGIERLAAALREGFEPAQAGIPPERKQDLQHLLPALEEGAAAVAGAEVLAEVREGFAELSKTLVAYRQMTPDPGSIVVFCPMAQKVWLQPGGEIGNPYHGQSMPRCGNVVSE